MASGAVAFENRRAIGGGRERGHCKGEQQNRAHGISAAVYHSQDVTAFAAAVVLMISGALCAFAQAPAPPGDVVGVGGFSHIVANVERSVAFYRDVLGLEMPNPPRPFDSTPWIIDMGNTPGAQSRPAILQFPDRNWASS